MDYTADRLDTFEEIDPKLYQKIKKIDDDVEIEEKKLELLKEKFKEIGASVRQDLVSNLREAINGSQSFGEALTNVLNNLKLIIFILDYF